MARRLAIPRRIKIRGTTWAVEVIALREHAGYCVRADRTIQLDAENTSARMQQVFVHELLHATWPAGIVPDDIEEKLIERLAPAWLRLLTSGQLVAVPEEVK